MGAQGQVVFMQIKWHSEIFVLILNQNSICYKTYSDPILSQLWSQWNFCSLKLAQAHITWWTGALISN